MIDTIPGAVTSTPTAALVLDVVLVVVLVAQAVTGWRQGLLVGVASLGGFAVGLIGGGLLVVQILGDDRTGPLRLLVVLGGGLVAGLVLQALGVAAAWALHRRMESRSWKVIDTVVGTVAAVLAAATVVWVLSWGLRTAPLPGLGRTVTESRVVTALDAVAPLSVQRAADRFFAQVSGEWFPRVFAGGQESIRPVDEPDAGILAEPAVQAAAASVVKVRGVATACDRPQEGSGFVLDEGTVVTNAHVVAGMPEPGVQVAGTGRFLPATVVAFDPLRDVAVLAVPDIEGSGLPLRDGAGGREGEAVAVAGFPDDGSYVVGAGRIREQITAVGDDIYGVPGARREVYSLRATVRPGNSGGPVLSAAGEVVGLVFARSTTDPTTGYALTVGELQDALSAELPAGAAADAPPVDVGGCAVG
ncbi:MAG: MarP family serine protease [Kineosporiaceae bacterium]